MENNNPILNCNVVDNVPDNSKELNSTSIFPWILLNRENTIDFLRSLLTMKTDSCPC